MPNNLRVNPWTGADESKRIVGEAITVPNGSSVRPGQPENDLKLAEVPRQDAPSSVRVYAAGSPTTAYFTEVAQVYEGNPTTAYGNLTYTQTGRDGTGLHYRYHSLMALSTLSGLPTVVDKVTLRLYLNATGSASYPAERTIGVHILQAAFNELTVTWNTSPAHNLVAEASFNVTVNGTYDVDITSIYQQWISSGNNYGLLLKDGNDPDTDTMRQFASDTDGTTSRRPQLIIDEPGDTLTEVAVNIAPSANQYSVNYELGLLRFNDAEISDNYLCDYWGKGSILWA